MTMKKRFFAWLLLLSLAVGCLAMSGCQLDDEYNEDFTLACPHSWVSAGEISVYMDNDTHFALQCRVCDFTDTSIADIEAHTATHGDEALFTQSIESTTSDIYGYGCNACDFTTTSLDNIQQHLSENGTVTDHEGNSVSVGYLCSTCGRIFAAPDDHWDLTHQYAYDVDENGAQTGTFTCQDCGEKFDSDKVAWKHTEDMSPQPTYTELYPHTSYSDGVVVERRTIEVFTYACRACDFTCNRESEIRSHLETAELPLHEPSYDSSTGSAEVYLIQCNHCTEEFVHHDHYWQHNSDLVAGPASNATVTLDNVLTSACSCGYTSSSPDLVKLHTVILTGTNPHKGYDIVYEAKPTLGKYALHLTGDNSEVQKCSRCQEFRWNRG